jgi:hypothetical protein
VLSFGTLAVTAGGTGVTTSTGSGNNVLSTSPTLVTPILGTPTSVTLTNGTGLPLTTGVTGTLPIANGGTGLTSTPANGALDIGNGTGFTRTTLTAGTNVTITNSSGGITIAATGGGSSQWTTSGSDIYYSTGFVSIGTTSPAAVNAALTVYNPNLSSSQIYLQNTGTGTGSTNGFRVLMGTTDVTMTNKENGPIVFETNDTERARIPATGGIQSGNCVSVGNATPSTSGAGITFPATQSASSNANTLDDYEEGSWTPNQGGGVTVVGTFSSVGLYTKVGRVVTVLGYIYGSTSLSVAANGVLTTNLPFSSAPGIQAFGECHQPLGGMRSSTTGDIGVCAVRFSETIANGQTVITSSGNTIWFSATYTST